MASSYGSYGRQVVLGVGGGISAYKSCELLRRLQDLNYSVTVVPTRASLNFVGDATWEALSGKPVATDLWNRVHEVPHVSIASQANAIIIAPATADLIGKLANGLGDDLLTNVVLASTAPVIVVPAMHTEMWQNAAVQANIALLRTRGLLVIEPDTGRLTGADSGPGRYPEVARIVSEVSIFLRHSHDATGKRVLISAGGTREPIDSVRYLGNHSSGKQGVALAVAAAARGAAVTLVAAHIDHDLRKELSRVSGVTVIDVGTAREMQTSLEAEFASHDILFMSAAVADARPSQEFSGKIEKKDLARIELETNPDILAGLGARKASGQVIVGFAAQAGADDLDDEAHAVAKLQQKQVDYLYLNNVSTSEIFGSDETQGVVLSADGQKWPFSRASKLTLAENLLDHALNKLG